MSANEKPLSGLLGRPTQRRTTTKEILSTQNNNCSEFSDWRSSGFKDKTKEALFVLIKVNDQPNARNEKSDQGWGKKNKSTQKHSFDIYPQLCPTLFKLFVKFHQILHLDA